ncbi:MAG: toll/interleukin-1 receptor domain-containing protein [Algicola sp.]|nr:toll/interleukin-1 receptor domain-containing protein [Algicola sp.]
MAKNIFVSYDFNDREVAQVVKNMVMQHKNDIDGYLTFVENDVSYNGPTAVNWEVEHTMENCDAALFVLGDQHHNSPWLNVEAQHAAGKHIPIMVTCLPGEDSAIPQSLVNENCTKHNWESGDLYTRMNEC